MLAMLFCFNSINAQTQKRRPGTIAAIDAAGALGGAGSVASIAGWLGWTPPTAVVAGIAIGAGAIVGGAGASLAAASKSQGMTPNNPKGLINDFPENYLNETGIIHNQIVYDYYSQNQIYNPQEFYEYIERNKDRYGFGKELYIDFKTVEEQYNIFKNVENFSAVRTYILDKLPEEVNEIEYGQLLDTLENTQDVNEAIAIIQNFESNEYRKEYADLTKGILGTFFSTYRHSLLLWNK